MTSPSNSSTSSSNMLSPVIRKMGPCGGDYCKDWDMDLTGVTRIVKIFIGHCAAIDAIEVFYDRDGFEESTSYRGGTGGWLAWVTLQENEYITSISGHLKDFDMTLEENEYRTSITDHLKGSWHYCNILRSLKFETNLKTTEHFGKQEGAPFKYSAPPGGQIIGFFGQCSKRLLVALGVYVKMSSGLIRKVGPWGGTVKDMDVTGITRISKICIRHRDVIETFMVYFDRNGLEDKTEAWGAEKREQDISWVRLQPSEYITSISGHIDMIIVKQEKEVFLLRSLKFKIFNSETNNSETRGPYGKEKGVSFELPALGGEIIGFFGRGDSFFTTIGVYVKAATSVSRNLRSTNVYKVGPCGSSAGDEMDMNLLGVTRILKIDVCHDKNVIHAFTVYFERFSCEESTNTWGGEGGELEEITLDSNEHITSISGHLGEVSNIYAVRSLKLKTSHHIHGPYGKEEGDTFRNSSSWRTNYRLSRTLQCFIAPGHWSLYQGWRSKAIMEERRR